MEGFNYENTETVLQKGGKIVRKVSIKKGRGYKSVTRYHKGKKVYTAKKPIHSHHIKMIKNKSLYLGCLMTVEDVRQKKEEVVFV